MSKKITISGLRALIKEEAIKLHRRTLLENERRELMKELSLSEYHEEEDEIPSNPEDYTQQSGYVHEESNIASSEIDSSKVLSSYLETALWVENLDDYSIEDLSLESIEKAKIDIDNFISIAGSLLDEIKSGEVGHNLLLTRNGHGAGFWDRNLGDKGERLSEIAMKMGSVNIYVGDDGLIYIE